MASTTLPATFTCSDCHRTLPVLTSPACGGTGYGLVEEDGMDHKICYECIAQRDRHHMNEHGKMALYLTTGRFPWTVSNWPGTLKFVVIASRHGSHNIAGSRIDVWFVDHNRLRWHGVMYGDNTQIVHCRRLKARKKSA